MMSGRWVALLSRVAVVLAMAVGTVVISSGNALAQDGEVTAEAMVEKGRALLAKKSWVPASAVFREALAKDPSLASAHAGLGRALQKRREWDKAIEVYTKALTAAPKWHKALYQLGYSYRKKGDYEKAAEFYQKYIDVVPSNPDAYYGLGQSYFKGGDNKEAVAAFKMYVEKEDRESEQKYVARAREIIASLEAEPGLIEEDAATDAEADVESPEGDVPMLTGEVGELVASGDRAFWADNLGEALRYYRAAAGRDEMGIEAHYKLGAVLAIRGDLVGAISAWEKVVQRDPNMKIAADNIARARKKLRSQADKGIDDPRLGLGLDDQLELAGGYLEGERAMMALRVLDPLADRFPEEPRVRAARGRSLIRLGRFEEAARDLEIALGQTPGDAVVLASLGEVYLHLADNSRALYFLRRYLERVDPTGQDSGLAPTRKIVERLEGAEAK